MNDITNPHDQFARAVFSRPDIAADFLTHYLPPEIAARLDCAALELVQSTFVDSELQSHHTDVLYRVPRRDTAEAVYVYVLLEHKSYPDKWVAFQLLRYMTRIWESVWNRKHKKLPVIIPLTLYHGKRGWKVRTQFADLVATGNDAVWTQFVPHFAYHLCDLSAHDESEMRGFVSLQTIILLLKHIFDKDLAERLPEFLRLLQKVLDEKSVIELLDTLLHYVAAAGPGLSREEVGKALQEAFPEQIGEVMETLADSWIQKGFLKGRQDGIQYGFQQGREQGIQDGLQQGREQGIQDGLQQGREQGIQDGVAAIALRQLQRRLGVLKEPLQEQIKGLSLQALEQLSEDLLDFARPADLTKWLKKHAKK